MGAVWDDTGATDAGSAYVFDVTTGSLLHTLNNPTPEVGDGLGDEFGGSMAISGNTIVVGAFGDDTGATDAGSAYVFDATTGALLHTLNNPTPEIGDGFGSSFNGNNVAISGNTIVVGAWKDDAGATDAGSAYVFDATSGVLLDTLNNPTPQDSERFSVAAITGNTMVVGAPYDITGGEVAGSAYIFKLVDADFNADGLYDVADIDLLVAAIASASHPVDFDLTGDGLVDLSDRDAWLAAAGRRLSSGNPYLLGDANLDGSVDGSDFGVWKSHKFNSPAAWSHGDFNADGIVDGLDFIEWNMNKFQSSDVATQIMLPKTLRQPREVVMTHPAEVNEDTPSGRNEGAAPLAPLAAKRVDAVFATRRRGNDQIDQQPKVDPFEHLSPTFISPWVT